MILALYEHMNRKYASFVIHGAIKTIINSECCQSRRTFSGSREESLAKTLSLRCLRAPRAGGDYVSHSVYWVAQLFLICTTTVELLHSLHRDSHFAHFECKAKTKKNKNKEFKALGTIMQGDMDNIRSLLVLLYFGVL